MLASNLLYTVILPLYDTCPISPRCFSIESYLTTDRHAATVLDIPRCAVNNGVCALATSAHFWEGYRLLAGCVRDKGLSWHHFDLRVSPLTGK